MYVGVIPHSHETMRKLHSIPHVCGGDPSKRLQTFDLV